MRATEAAWAAGFYDGEGSSFVYQHRPQPPRRIRTQLELTVTQCGPEAPFLLERFRAVVGHGTVSKPIKTPTGHLSRYQWRVNSITRSFYVMRTLWPYLGPTKKRQFIKAVRESVRDSRLRKQA